MTDAPSAAPAEIDVAHPSHNPFDLPQPRRNNGVIIAVVFTLLIHGIIGFYLYQWKFAAKYQTYSDEKTDAQIIKPPPPPPPVITNPDWVSRPNGDEINSVYPDRAQRMEVSGRAELTCTVTEKGTVANCSVVSEDPADQQFGAAAMKLTRYFKMRPSTRDGQPVGGAKINIPIRFTIAKE